MALHDCRNIVRDFVAGEDFNRLSNRLLVELRGDCGFSIVAPTRRAFLKLGSAAGLSLAEMLRLKASAACGGRTTDKIGGSVIDRPVTPPDMAATILHAMGIDPATTVHTPLGRPVELASGGKPVLELFT